ncbi:hypothetical protein ILUMI_18207, partial [Ignelater luminosus]
MFWIAIVLGLVTFIYFILIKPFQYWESKGVPQLTILRVWYESARGIFQFACQAEIIKSVYDTFPGSRYVGGYQFFKPMLFLKDPDLIKQLTVKDFDHFLDHNQPISEEIEPIFGKKPISIERFANDVIASTAFGIACDSLKDRENEYYLMGKKATNFRGAGTVIKFILLFMCPTLSKLLGLKLFHKSVSEFFLTLVKTNIESRKKNAIVRPDMIYLLMEARKGRLKHEKSD